MTTTEGQLRIRPPLWARAWIVLFLPVWLWFFFQQMRSEAVTAFSVIIGVAAVVLGGRMLIMGVVGTADGRLTVRNQLWTRTFRREDLADAVVDRSSRSGMRGSGWAVWIVLKDGSRHFVQLTEAPFRPGYEGRLQGQAAKIRAWIDAEGRPQPFL